MARAGTFMSTDSRAAPMVPDEVMDVPQFAPIFMPLTVMSGFLPRILGAISQMP